MYTKFLCLDKTVALLIAIHHKDKVTADYISREDLEFRKNQREVVYFTEARRAQIFDGTTDVVVPSMPVKVVAATGVVVGTNKFVTGLGKVWNGFYGSEVGKTPNPIRDRILTKYQDMYDAAEIVLEVGIAHTAPYANQFGENVKIKNSTFSKIRKTTHEKSLETPVLYKEIKNDIINLPKKGSANKIDQYHNFNKIVDNYGKDAKKYKIPNGTLYQLEGSLNGVNGRFEWIIQDEFVTHRMFIPQGKVNGVPIRP